MTEPLAIPKEHSGTKAEQAAFMVGYATARREEQAELQTLRDTVGKLPKTADGVAVTPGMEVWVWQDGELRHVYATCFDLVTDDWWLRYGMYDWCIQDVCYSTEAAARAAGESDGT